MPHSWSSGRESVQDVHGANRKGGEEESGTQSQMSFSLDSLEGIMQRIMLGIVLGLIQGDSIGV